MRMEPGSPQRCPLTGKNKQVCRDRRRHAFCCESRQHGHGLPRGAVEALSLEILRTRPDALLSSWLRVALLDLRAGPDDLRIPSRLSLAVTLPHIQSAEK